MTSLLLTLSFLIHIILLLAMYSLYKELQVLKTENTNANEIAEVFESYLKEIKVENERLEKETLMPSKKLDELKVHTEKEKEFKPYNKSAFEDETKKDYKPLEPYIKDDVDTTLESQVLQLASQGYLSNEIAGKLNCGKTEAELIIKLHSKSNR